MDRGIRIELFGCLAFSIRYLKIEQPERYDRRPPCFLLSVLTNCPRRTVNQSKVFVVLDCDWIGLNRYQLFSAVCYFGYFLTGYQFLIQRLFPRTPLPLCFVELLLLQ